MKQAKYPVVASNDPFVYVFYSEGPKGRIKKGIFFTKIGDNFFNLGFGDWNEQTQNLNDSSRSNNGDRNKVLVTVALAALDFTNQYPGAWLFIEGSTPARTRLYQMGITANLLEINENFEVRGHLDSLWEPFQRGRNYDAFLINRK